MQDLVNQQLTTFKRELAKMDTRGPLGTGGGRSTPPCAAVANWNRSLKRSEIEVESPYITRLRLGLLPGPIGSFGPGSSRAAANPAPTGFLHLVAKPGTCGEHDLSRSEAEFLASEARYDRRAGLAAARARRAC